MPMLERTAASLEPCNIQRVLPSTSTANPFTSRRRLQTTFWQHGAADTALSNACQVVSRGALESPEPCTPAHSLGDSVIASTFLLDFLYPHGAATLLRKLSPSVLERYERPKGRPRTHGPRLYTSAATSLQSSREASQLNFQSRSTDGFQLKTPTFEESERGRSLVTHDQGENSSGRPTVLAKDVGTDEMRERNVIKGLRQLLLVQEPNEEQFGRIWDAYHELNPDLRPSIRSEVIASLAQSKSPRWAARIVQLFAELSPLQWDSRLVSIAIRANLRLGKDSEAVRIFQQALRRQNPRGSSTDDLVPTDGLGDLVLRTLQNSAWDMLFDIWRHIFNLSPDYKFKVTVPQDLADIPGIDTKISTLYHLTSEDNGLHVALRKKFLRPLLRVILPQFQPDRTFDMVKHTGDPSLLKTFILLCISRKQSQLAHEAYTAYRTLPGVQISFDILCAMVRDVYYPSNDAAGMEMLLKDWYEGYGKLGIIGYQKSLAFYASRGDVQSVNRMWKEYVEHYPHVLKGYTDTFTYLLQVHVVRGDIQQVRKTFDEIKELHSTEPPTECWNVLLNAYVKINDYDEALKLFDDLCSSTKPDHYSFGTMMGMSGSRGDLDTTLKLYRLSRDRQVKPSITMLDCIIEAYCQNDAFALAENICVMTTRKRRMRGNYTLLWNTLLHHHALRLDLKTVNRLLGLMSQMDVPYDHKTFDSLLKALIFCRQSHHALHLLRVAANEHAFQPTQSHYILLMSAFIKTDEPFRAIRTHNMLNDWGFPETSERMLKVVDAVGQYRHLPSYDEDTSGKAMKRLNVALREFRQPLQDEKQGTTFLTDGSGTLEPTEKRNAVSKSSEKAELASMLIFLFSQMRDFATVQQIVELYNSSAPQSEERTEMPLELMSSILYADFCERKFEKVQDTWMAIFNQACKIARPPGVESGMLPRYHYLLADPLKTMLRTYEAQKRPNHLKKLISEVTLAGFKLDNKSFNYYVQALARLKQWQDAFTVCEEALLPRWTGWGVARRRQRVKNLLPLDLRRIGSSREYLRPIAHTMFVLAKEYTVIEELAPWSPENSRVLDNINRHCPRTVGAIKAMRRTDSEAEEAIFSELALDLDGQTTEPSSSQLNDDDLPLEKQDSPSNKTRGLSGSDLNELLGEEQTSQSKGNKKKKRSWKTEGLSAEEEDFLSKGLGPSGTSSGRGTLPQFDGDDEAWLSDNSDIAPDR